MGCLFSRSNRLRRWEAVPERFLKSAEQVAPAAAAVWLFSLEVIKTTAEP